jgi:hypothetical protein
MLFSVFAVICLLAGSALAFNEGTLFEPRITPQSG